MKLTKEIKTCNISSLYTELLESFSAKKHEKLNVNLNKTRISEAIYFHLCKIKYAGWKHRINFNRYKKHTIAEIFQDLIAYYLKLTLSKEYECLVEKKVKNTQPDILIKKNGVNHFIIELKTNIGWERPDSKSDAPFIHFTNRIRNLSNNFNIKQENIIYIFEEHSNVSKEFSNYFWDKEKEKPKERTNKFPFSKFYPLFNATDPYYWKYEKGFKSSIGYKDITDDEIINRSKNNIVTPIEMIIKIILGR